MDSASGALHYLGPVARVLPYEQDPASLIGSLRNELKIKGDIMSTGVRWDAER